MCFKIPADIEKDAAERRLSMEKLKDLDHVETEATRSESGVMAMLRKLFNSFSGGTTRSPRDASAKRTTEETREVERVD